MLHCNGADESTTFTDDSNSAHTVTANGNAEIDTAQYKFGGASALFDASAGTFLSIANSDDFNPGSGDFTIAFQVRFNSTSGTQVLIGRNGSSDRSWVVYYTSGNLHFAGYWNSSIQDETFAWTPSVDTWYHGEIGRDGANLRVFIEGNQIGSTYNISNYSIRSSSSVFYIGENVEETGYRLNGWLDEIKWDKGIVRHTSNFTPPSSEYFGNASLDIDESFSLNDSWSIQTNPALASIEETISFDDEWLIYSNPEQESIDNSISLSDNWSITTDEHTDYATKVISYNPLIYVTNTDPAKIASINISDPSNPIKTVYTITGCKYAQDVILNDTNDYFYVICAEGKVAKIEKSNLSNQTIINTGETDNLVLGAILENYFKTYVATDDANGEIVMIDEATITSLNTDLRFIQQINTIISTRLDTILGSIFNTDLRYKVLSTSKVNTDLRWLKYSYATTSQYPIDFDDIIVKINGTDLCPLNDVNLKSIIITHNIDEEEEIGSQATFFLNRRHDKLDYDNQGNSSQITNQNAIVIIINGITEFSGKIAHYHTNSEEETVQVTAKGTRSSDRRHTVSIPMSSLNTDLNLFDCLVHDVNVDNPYIDPTSENPEYYKGIEVDLGTEIEQNILKFQSFQNVTTLAEDIESGDFQPKQNWTYFWFAKFRNFVTNRVQATLVYLGSSLGSISTDTYTLEGTSYKYQKQLDDTETELGVYQSGSAPYNTISVKNGKKIVKDKYEDRNDGLYITRDEGYDYEQYAKDIADLEYQKLQNINGDVLPITTATIDVSFNAYYYYNLKLLTRINVTNTTTSNIYKNNNGFPISVKTITINTGTMIVSLSCSNQKSQVELLEIDAQYPDEEDETYLFPEEETKIASKFDPATWSYIV